MYKRYPKDSYVEPACMFAYISLYTTPPSHALSKKKNSKKNAKNQLKSEQTVFFKNELSPLKKKVNNTLATRIPVLVGLASHIANGSRRVHRHRGRLANADGSKALVGRSLEGA